MPHAPHQPPQADDESHRGDAGAPTPVEAAAMGGSRAGAGAPAHFIGHAWVVASLTGLSRVAGLARDAVCSRVFGAGPVFSAFVAAFTIPNLFRRLFGEGALSAAFIPEYARLSAADPALAARYASAVVGVTVAALGAVTIVGECALLALLLFSPLRETGALTLWLSVVMLPYMPLVCASALLAGMLQAHGRFGPPAAAPIILNLFMIAAAGAFMMGRSDDLVGAAFAVSASVLAAGVVQCVWSLGALRGRHAWGRGMGGVGAPLRRTIRQAIPVLIGLGALQFSSFMDQLIAAWPVVFGPTFGAIGLPDVAYPLDERANSVLFFAQRLYQFPLGVFGIAIATAVFPALSRSAGDAEGFTATLRRGLRLSAFIGLPATAGLIAVRGDLTAVVYEGGRFEAGDAARVSATLLGYAVAVWAYTLSHTLTRAFYALGDMRTPMRLALGAVALNLVLNLTLMWPLREAGLAWATAISAILQCVALLAMSAKRLHHPALERQETIGLLWSLGLTLLMAGALGLLSLAPLPGDSWAGRLLRLTITVALGGGVYIACAFLTKRPELRWLRERAARRGS